MPKNSKNKTKKRSGVGLTKAKKVQKSKNFKLVKASKKSKLNSLNNITGMLVFFGVAAALFACASMGYMYKSVKNSETVLAGSVMSAKSMLAYNSQDIQTAGIVGDKEQLISEINGWQSASSDLQDYAMQDYKAFKKACIVNGQLFDQTHYDIKSVVYDNYALVGKYCNGVENNVLVKMSGVWTVVYSSNDLMPCSLVNDLKIPQGISLRCATGGTTYLNPNP